MLFLERLLLLLPWKRAARAPFKSQRDTLRQSITKQRCIAVIGRLPCQEP